MKYSVICSVGEGDEVDLIGLFSDFGEACASAKRNAHAVVKDLNDDRQAAGTTDIFYEVEERVFVSDIVWGFRAYFEIKMAGMVWYVGPVASEVFKREVE